MTRSYHTLEWSVMDRIGHLVMTQPPSNKMTVEFFRDMNLVKKIILGTPDLKAIILSGKGRHFSSGADLDELLLKINQHAEAETFLQSNYTSLSYFETLQLPVISAIRGVCLGSAMELALFTNYRFCGEDTVFGLPETTFNLIPGIGGIRRFVNLSGKARALDYILTGRTFSSEIALDLGIVDMILPKRELLSQAVDFAKWLPERYLPVMRRVYLERYKKVRGER